MSINVENKDYKFNNDPNAAYGHMWLVMVNFFKIQLYT